MSVQNIIAAIIIIAALAYVGSMIVRKLRSFSPKSKCASDCGCATNRDQTIP